MTTREFLYSQHKFIFGEEADLVIKIMEDYSSAQNSELEAEVKSCHEILNASDANRFLFEEVKRLREENEILSQIIWSLKNPA